MSADKTKNEAVHDISKIEFGLYSREEILALSVAEITSTKKSGPNSIYDPRMGAEGNKPCLTCGNDIISCPGHFGHIDLAVPIIHPLYLKTLTSILKCVCFECHSLKLDKMHLIIAKNFKDNETGFKKFKCAKDILSDIDICMRCGGELNKERQPQVLWRCNTSENTITMTLPDKNKKITIDADEQYLLDILKDLKPEDLNVLGINHNLAHPSSMIMTALPVIPPCARPFVKAAGNVCDDDLSNQYVEILKVNKKLKTMPETKRSKNIQTLKFRIATTFNNSSGKAKHTTNGRPVKCIKTRISGKEGQMRSNIMGRRVDQTSRTVIGPDPTLKNDEMIIPKYVADILTIPVRVTSLNIKEVTDLANSGKARYVVRKNGDKKKSINLQHAILDKGTPLLQGDKIITKSGQIFTYMDESHQSHIRMMKGVQPGDRIVRDGVEIESIPAFKKKIELYVGDIVERCLRDGDTVILNRQPTLHKASMMAFKIFIKPGNTFRFNLACTKAFNADFDGDEMNVHVPQSLEAIAEIKNLSTVQKNLIGCQSSKMNICMVQDGVLGAYLMTKPKGKVLRKDQFFNCTMRLSLSTNYVLQRMVEIKKVVERYNRKQKSSSRSETRVLSGRGLVSLILPSDFFYKKKTLVGSDEPTLIIENGVILKGALTKETVSSGHNCIPHYIHNEYGEEKCLDFINNMQFITNAYLEITSFSIGLLDCMSSRKFATVSSVEDTVYKCFMQAEALKKETKNQNIRESRVNAALVKAKDIGLKIAKDSLDPRNSFISTVVSGSKGDFFNIAQINGLLGQQNLSGKRLPLFLNNGTRSIPHYPKETTSNKDKYESRGFISSSFIKGLNPREFFFHACSGREGMSDTAVGTAVSGYIQRRIVKLQEDMRVNYDGTVRDETGRIFQMMYGEGLDPTSTLKGPRKTQTCIDVVRLAERLNREASP
jgi:DNA-directed RNA polymerase beta' subunit